MKWDDSEMGSHHACTVIFRVRVPVAPPKRFSGSRADRGSPRKRRAFRKTNTWPHRLAVRTLGFQSGNRGSTPRGATKDVNAFEVLVAAQRILTP